MKCCCPRKGGKLLLGEFPCNTNTAYKHGVGFFDAIKAAFTGNALALVAQWG